jgi:hypothetical protein
VINCRQGKLRPRPIYHAKVNGVDHLVRFWLMVSDLSGENENQK